YRGTRYDISALDLAIMSDAGVVISRLGDIDRDGQVNVADIAVAETALADLSGYQATHGNITNAQLLSIGDLNGDGRVTNADLQGLINLLANGGGSGSLNAVPEPPGWILAFFAFPIGMASAVVAKKWSMLDRQVIDKSCGSCESMGRRYVR